MYYYYLTIAPNKAQKMKGVNRLDEAVGENVKTSKKMNGSRIFWHKILCRPIAYRVTCKHYTKDCLAYFKFRPLNNIFQSRLKEFAIYQDYNHTVLNVKP